jgi:hypothetical protein
LNIINGIDDPRLTDPSTNLNPEFSVTGSTYYDYYPAYIGRDSGDEILSDSFNMGSLDDISIIITYAGKVGIDGKEYDDTISYSSPTYNSGSVDTIATQTLHISTASTITKILITAAQDSTKIYDIQIFGVGSSDGSMYYTDDGLTLTDMYDGSTTLLSAITNAKLIGTLNIGKVRNEKIFNFVQINKRGGGLNEDDIIEQITGYDRYSQFPDSYDYADIARRDNMPFNPRKYIIVKLPISIIGELMTKEQRINAGIGSRELRQKIINRIYAIIRRDMPAGAYFKIYDYNNDPWPEENSL